LKIRHHYEKMSISDIFKNETFDPKYILDTKVRNALPYQVYDYIFNFKTLKYNKFYSKKLPDLFPTYNYLINSPDVSEGVKAFVNLCFRKLWVMCLHEHSICKLDLVSEKIKDHRDILFFEVVMRLYNTFEVIKERAYETVCSEMDQVNTNNEVQMVLGLF